MREPPPLVQLEGAVPGRVATIVDGIPRFTRGDEGLIFDDVTRGRVEGCGVDPRVDAGGYFGVDIWGYGDGVEAGDEFGDEGVFGEFFLVESEHKKGGLKCVTRTTRILLVWVTRMGKVGHLCTRMVGGIYIYHHTSIRVKILHFFLMNSYGTRMGIKKGGHRGPKVVDFFGQDWRYFGCRRGCHLRGVVVV